MPIDFTKPEPQLPQWVAPAAPPLTFTPLPESYYRHSGKAPFQGIILSLGIGVGLGILIAFAYAYVLVYLPFVALRVIAPIIYAIVAAAVFGLGLKAGKIRNTLVALILCGAMSLATFYFVWTGWIFALLQREGAENVTLMGVLTSPILVWKLILQFNEVGVWGIRGTTFSGPFLSFIWLLEMGVIILAPFLGVMFSLESPFCETCNDWTEDKKTVREFKRVASPAELKEILRRKDYGVLLGHPRRAGDEVFYRADVHKCKSCNVLHVLKVEEITLAIDQNGKANESKKTVVENLLINASEMAALGS